MWSGWRQGPERDFGLKAAAGIVDARSLRAIDSRSMERAGIQIRRQSTSGLDTQEMGLNVGREMMRSVTGLPADSSLGRRVTGRDSVALSRTVERGEIAGLLAALRQTYTSKAYQRDFVHLDRWGLVDSASRIRELDAQLVETLTKRHALLEEGALSAAALPTRQPGPTLEAPGAIEWAGAALRTSVEPDEAAHPFPDIDAYLRALPAPPKSSDLRKKHFQALIDHDTSEVREAWSIYDALNWEVEVNGTTFLLVEGAWWSVDKGYKRRIALVLDTITESTLAVPRYDGLVNDEAAVNAAIVQVDANRRVLIDTQKAGFRHENGTVEPCDVITADRQLVYVKSARRSSALSHLFAQASVAARLLLVSDEFRKHLRGHVATSKAIEALIEPGRPRTGEWEVVLGLISDRQPPVLHALPFFARNHLAQVAEDIQSMGYRLTFAHIRPEAALPPTTATGG